MGETLDFETDFTLPLELVEVRRALADDLQMVCTVFAEGAIERGLSEAEACTVVVDLFIQMAAGTACRVRRDLLNGEPDYDRWRCVTDDAFKRAVRYTADEEPSLIETGKADD